MPTPTLPITTLDTSISFRTWLARTNTIIDLINSGAILISAAANGGAIGAFTIGNTVDTTSSLTIAGGKFFSNATGTFLTGTATLGANLTVNASAANIVFSSTSTYLLSPTTVIGSANLFVNTSVTVNGSATFANGTLTVSNNATFNSNVSVANNLTSSNTIYARSIVFNHSASIVAATLSSASYDNYSPDGLIDAIALNINPDTQDIALTGIAAPSNMSSGARVLYIQNTNGSYKITLRNANTSSSVGNRFLTGGGDLDIPPQGALPLLYSFSTGTWRPLAAPSGSVTTLTVGGVASVGGTLSVAGNTALTANLAVDTNVLFVDTVNNRVGVNIIPLHPLHVSGNGVIANNLTIGQTLSVTGAVTLSNTVSITGAVNTASTLGVAGLLSAASGLDVTGSANTSTSMRVGTTLTVLGVSTLTGAVNTSSTLGVSGLLSALNGLSVTGSGTFSSTVLTNGLLTANAGLTVNGQSTFSSYRETTVALGTVGATATINITSGSIVTATLTNATTTTFTMPSASAGASFLLYLKQPASTGSGAASFTGVRWSSAGAPTITTGASKMDLLSFISDGTYWYGSYIQGFSA